MVLCIQTRIRHATFKFHFEAIIVAESSLLLFQLFLLISGVLGRCSDNGRS